MRSLIPAPRRRLSFGFSLGSFAALLIFLPATARAQNFADDQKWELGGHFATLSLPSQCSTSTNCDSIDNGLGATLTYNFSAWLGADSEMDFFGANGNASTSSTGGRVTEGLFGFRLGPTTRRWGLYSEVRPGFVSFSHVLDQSQGGSALASPAGALGVTPQFTARLGYQASQSSSPLAMLGLTSATDFAFNYGEAIEYRPTKHAALRIDVGDTIVTYPGAALGLPLHQHNFQVSEAIVIRF
jgi:hypothetical protein